MRATLWTPHTSPRFVLTPFETLAVLISTSRQHSPEVPIASIYRGRSRIYRCERKTQYKQHQPVPLFNAIAVAVACLRTCSGTSKDASIYLYYHTLLKVYFQRSVRLKQGCHLDWVGKGQQ